FTIDLCSTPINLSYIKKKIPHKYSCSIQLVEFHLPYMSEPPPHYHTTNGLPLHLQSTLYKAFMISEPQLYQILKDTKLDVLIVDAMGSKVIQDVEDMEETELIEWLGKQKEHSTLYVSFGSENKLALFLFSTIFRSKLFLLHMLKHLKVLYFPLHKSLSQFVSREL
uniref:Uncharacterized protein n=1 Tax=Solanum lycopersicum TaxID=4081 RepID=A0A3Q7GPC5_SOLLC